MELPNLYKNEAKLVRLIRNIYLEICGVRMKLEDQTKAEWYWAFGYVCELVSKHLELNDTSTTNEGAAIPLLRGIKYAQYIKMVQTIEIGTTQVTRDEAEVSDLLKLVKSFNSIDLMWDNGDGNKITRSQLEGEIDDPVQREALEAFNFLDDKCRSILNEIKLLHPKLDSSVLLMKAEVPATTLRLLGAFLRGARLHNKTIYINDPLSGEPTSPYSNKVHTHGIYHTDEEAPTNQIVDQNYVNSKLIELINVLDQYMTSNKKVDFVGHSILYEIQLSPQSTAFLQRIHTTALLYGYPSILTHSVVYLLQKKIEACRPIETEKWLLENESRVKTAHLSAHTQSRYHLLQATLALQLGRSGLAHAREALYLHRPPSKAHTPDALKSDVATPDYDAIVPRDDHHQHASLSLFSYKYVTITYREHVQLAILFSQCIEGRDADPAALAALAAHKPLYAILLALKSLRADVLTELWPIHSKYLKKHSLQATLPFLVRACRQSRAQALARAHHGLPLARLQQALPATDAHALLRFAAKATRRHAHPHQTSGQLQFLHKRTHQPHSDVIPLFHKQIQDTIALNHHLQA